MRLHFYKYHGTGNDFIMIDDREGHWPAQAVSLVPRLCDRHFGIGSDGLILIRNHPEADFEMVYFNPDGSQSLCGNGSRCAVAFARDIGIIQGESTTFMAYDGLHFAHFEGELIHLKMADNDSLQAVEQDYFADTGSPHYVRFQSLPDAAGLLHIAKEIRYSDRFAADGINVNLAEQVVPGHLRVRTYERGVEAETFSCGTGVVACAVSDAHRKGLYGPFRYELETLGGTLTVTGIRSDDGSVSDIWLIGPAARVYEGVIEG